MFSIFLHTLRFFFAGLFCVLHSINYNYNIDIRQSLSPLTTFDFLGIWVESSFFASKREHVTLRYASAFSCSLHFRTHSQVILTQAMYCNVFSFFEIRTWAAQMLCKCSSSGPRCLPNLKIFLNGSTSLSFENSFCS